MLYFPKTRVSVSLELPIAVGASVQAEGIALVADNTTPVFGVKPSAGVAGELFLGVSISQEFPLLAYPKVEENVQPVANTLVLARTPIAGSLAVFDITSGLALVLGTDYTISAKTLTLVAGTVGHSIRSTYKFVPTAFEAETIMGDVYPGGAAGTRFGQVGVLKSGPIYTTEFDAAINWAQATPVMKTGANGQFTVGGNGALVPGVVIQVPNIASPFLGILLASA
jgi:hypothetical protein